MKDMTESELHAIMTGGFSTIAGSVFGVYISFGIDATALLAASVMSAPAALAISKLSYPETEDSVTSNRKKGAFDVPKAEEVNVVDAACKGAVTGMQLVLNITANLIAFLAIIDMINELIIYLGNRVDVNISLFIICEYLFFPFAWLMGVDPEDCRRVGNVIGLKIIANEVRPKMTTSLQRSESNCSRLTSFLDNVVRRLRPIGKNSRRHLRPFLLHCELCFGGILESFQYRDSARRSNASCAEPSEEIGQGWLQRNDRG